MKVLLLSLFLTSSITFGNDLPQLLSEYTEIKNHLTGELNERTERRYLKDIEVLTATVEDGISAIDAEYTAYKLYYKQLIEAKNAQLEVASLGIDLLSARSVNTEGIAWSIPSFNLDSSGNWRDFRSAYNSIEALGVNFDRLERKLLKRKKALLRKLGGVAPDNQIIASYDEYIFKARRLESLSRQIAKLLCDKIIAGYDELDNSGIIKDTKKLRKAVESVARHLSAAKTHFIKAQKTLQGFSLN
jgi:hypothetical protein